MCGSTALYACAYVTAGEERMYLSEFEDGKSVDLFVTQKDLLQTRSHKQRF